MDKGRVVIELAPDFAPKNVENIKKLVREGYFDGLAMIRSQDNYTLRSGATQMRSANSKQQPKS